MARKNTTLPFTFLQKWYTRIIGIAFLLVVISLILDVAHFGHRPESWHKAFHVLLGSAVVYWGWNNSAFWRPFCLANGFFFAFVAAFGWTFPDFAMLDAFNFTDTILHTIVGIAGIIIGLHRR
ncbi:hypothetical protein GF342_01420 [Candidatus Woesearchaeota archaeon]|nr:hypothetical protein [Candidatus Woesearchaeota archaeon]